MVFVGHSEGGACLTVWGACGTRVFIDSGAYCTGGISYRVLCAAYRTRSARPTVGPCEALVALAGTDNLAAGGRGRVTGAGRARFVPGVGLEGACRAGGATTRIHSRFGVTDTAA